MIDSQKEHDAKKGHRSADSGLVVVDQKPGEAAQALVRRFNRDAQSYGIAAIVRERRFFIKKPNRRRRRDIASRKEKIRLTKRGW